MGKTTKIIALRVMEQTRLYLGAGIPNLINLFNVQLVVVGGWVETLLGTSLLSRIEPMVSQYAMQAPLNST